MGPDNYIWSHTRGCGNAYLFSLPCPNAFQGSCPIYCSVQSSWSMRAGLIPTSCTCGHPVRYPFCLSVALLPVKCVHECWASLEVMKQT